MEWTESLARTVQYLEAHLLDDAGAQAAAKAAAVSPFYLQTGFRMVTGYSIGEYVRSRRLYLATLELVHGDAKVIDLAYKYGYDTPESFTKAFTRFHSATPAAVRKGAGTIRVFLPLRISLVIQGGYEMDYRLEKMDAFRVIGFERTFSFDTSYREIPKFWEEIGSRYLGPLCSGKEPSDAAEQAICRCMIGEFGVCVEDAAEEGRFRYLIAGRYDGGGVPQGMTVFELPALEWAKFACPGPLPTSLQSVNTEIFQKWLPENPDFEMAFNANIEWYSQGDGSALDYRSEIWVPVRRRAAAKNV